MLRLSISAIALLLAASPANAEDAASEAHPGDAYEIRWQQETKETTGDRDSGSSKSHSTYAERIVAVGEAGVEVEFDLSDGASARDREREWTFPARILKRSDGSLELLNEPELEARLEIWLEKAKWPREVCDRWIFTWTALQINCDPQSVIRTYRTLDIAGGGEATTKDIDAEAVRRERAEADVIVAEINGRTLAIEEALAAHAAEQVSGTIATSFERESPERSARTQLIEVQVVGADGVAERRKTTEKVTRTLVSRSAP